MTEDAFLAFYERTAPAVWAYLVRVTGDRSQADDLLQEACFRMLRSAREYESDEHRRHALFVIAPNLARDTWRKRKSAPGAAVELPDELADGSVDVAGHAIARTDLHRALGRLRVRDRQLLLLAYGQGWSHKEIASALGVTVASVKLLVWRARRRILTHLEPLARNGGTA